MIKAYLEAFTQAAGTSGITRLKFYCEESRSRELTFYEGALEQLERSEQTRLFVEGEVAGLTGSIFIENLDESLIPEHVRRILESAESCNALFVPYELEGLEVHDSSESEFLDLGETLDRMARAEQTALSTDSRVEAGVQLQVSEKFRRITLSDGRGHYATDSTGEGNMGIHLVVREGDQVQPGGKHLPFRGDRVPDLSNMAREAVEVAISKLGAESYATGAFPAVLDSHVVAELLDAFMPAFLGKNVNSHMSVLAGRLGEALTGSNISILEDPTLEGGFSARRFDDEGVPTTKKQIVENGVLRCFLHNRQSAAQVGAVSGGNGFKNNYSEQVSTGYTNVYIPGGDKTRDQLLEEMGDGLLITSVSGVFAGARPNSGDFSLISNGYRVEKGQLGRAVTQITIAGNFFDVLKDVASVGSDESWMCTNVGCIRTPSLYVRKLAISGKE